MLQYFAVVSAIIAACIVPTLLIYLLEYPQGPWGVTEGVSKAFLSTRKRKEKRKKKFEKKREDQRTKMTEINYKKRIMQKANKKSNDRNRKRQLNMITKSAE